MKPIKLLIMLLLAFMVLSFKTTDNSKWTMLYNGRDFNGWDTYIGPNLDDNGKPITDKPIGLNNDPRHVFSVVEQNGEQLIRVSGENWGALSTKKEYENYHLQLQFKWGALSWGQKKNKNKDSGLLYHSVGRYGADYGAWMRSQEFQIEQTNCGEYWGVAGGVADIPVIKKSATEYIYSPQGVLTTFKEGGPQGRHCMKNVDAEKPAGEWNTVDLYCHGDTSVHVVNGKVVMVLYHNRQQDDGQEKPLTKGKIQIQSEGAEVFYRNVRIQTIRELPAGLVNQ